MNNNEIYLIMKIVPNESVRPVGIIIYSKTSGIWAAKAVNHFQPDIFGNTWQQAFEYFANDYHRFDTYADDLMIYPLHLAEGKTLNEVILAGK